MMMGGQNGGQPGMTMRVAKTEVSQDMMMGGQNGGQPDMMMGGQDGGQPDMMIRRQDGGQPPGHDDGRPRGNRRVNLT